MHGALNYRVMAIFCPEYKKIIKEYETTVSKIIYYGKNKKTNFWRIFVKFQLWVPLSYLGNGGILWKIKKTSVAHPRSNLFISYKF